MKNNFFELPIPTRDGQFIARYSEKGLAEMDFPAAGPTRRGGPDFAARGFCCLGESVSRWHRATEAALKNILAGRAAKTAAAGPAGNGISAGSLARTAENLPRQNKKLRRNRAGDWQAQGRPRRRRRVRRESDPGFGSLPSRAGREQKTRRLLRRIELETQVARAGRCQSVAADVSRL